jgi:hypothetical protein
VTPTFTGRAEDDLRDKRPPPPEAGRGAWGVYGLDDGKSALPSEGGRRLLHKPLGAPEVAVIYALP